MRMSPAATTSPKLFGNSEELIARMPYFEKRSIQTQVTISDGSTVVMGGLVDERTETFRDQVPFLGDLPYIGRFFRSEGSRNQKKNLVITVKATQVDDRGMTREERRALSKQIAVFKNYIFFALFFWSFPGSSSQSHRGRNMEFIAFDLETTGTPPNKDAIVEIGAVRFQGAKPEVGFGKLINLESQFRMMPLR